MTTRQGTLFTVMGLILALIATGASARESRLRALQSKLMPSDTQATAAPHDAPQDFNTVAELRSVHFDIARAEARSADAPILDADAAWLRANPTYPILIAGYADERGANRYNLALGQRRAAWVRDQLVARGVPADRISMMSYGERGGPCREHTPECWAEKRRADILAVRLVEPQRP